MDGIDAIGMDYSKLTPLPVEAVNALRAVKDAQIEAPSTAGVSTMRLAIDGQAADLASSL